jgi:4-methyl-5(b-hydroxyethyl)-thiazole monophosphate biosynthesis
MRILVLLYQEFAEFEATLLGYVARCEGHEIVTTAPSEVSEVTGMGGFQVRPQKTVDTIDPDDYAALLVPGGDWQEIIDRQEVSALIRAFFAAGKVVAAICSGPIQLAQAGILAGKDFTSSLSQNHRGVFDWSRRVDAPVVVDGNVITAKGECFVDFTFTVMEKLKAYGDPANAEEWRKEYGCPSVAS